MTRDNLPYLLVLICFEYCCVSLLCLYFKERSRTFEKEESDIEKNRFQSVYHCIAPDNFTMRIFLLISRIFWLTFFSVCGAFIYIEFLRPDASNIQYFTFWNVFIIVIYYSLTTIASLIGICMGQSHADQCRYYRFGVIVNIFFEVVGSTAIWITVVNFAFLDSTLSYLNTAPHLFTSVALLTEMLFSAMVVDGTHLIYLFTWVLLYILTIMVLYPATGELDDWPYWFLDTTSSACYFWYTAMFLALALSYLVWWSLSAVKCRYLLIPLNADEGGKDLTERLLDPESQSSAVPAVVLIPRLHHGASGDEYEE